MFSVQKDKELLDKLNVSKSKGPSVFSPKILKLDSPGIARSMTKLFKVARLDILGGIPPKFEH